METKPSTPQLQVHAPAAPDLGAGPEKKTTPPGAASAGGLRQGVSKVGILALLMALAALALALGERFSADSAAIHSLNQSYTSTILPQLNKANERHMLGAVYDLRHMMITLDEVKELTEREDIKVAVDKVRRDLQELSVKILVHG